MKELDAFWKEVRSEVEAYLDSIMPPEDEEPEEFHKALRYAVFSGGKRFRPLLVFLGAYLGETHHDKLSLLKLAGAVELIHNFTLVHDDLPALDNDDFRRGKETVHRKFGEDMAILVGDGLFALAYKLMSNLPWEVVSTITDALLSKGVIGGQVMDVRRMASSKEDVLRIHEYKTAKLIQASLLSGYMLSHGEKEELVSQIGLNIGKLFQLTDDLLDQAKEDELSILQFAKREEVEGMIDSLSRSTKELALSSFGSKAELILQLVDRIANRNE